MAQHDLNIANQTFPNTRADINSALEALATLSSGVSAPTDTFPNMLWYDTNTNFLNKRTEADDGWDKILFISGSGLVRLVQETALIESDGTIVNANLTPQAQTVWNTGTSNTDTLIAPSKLKTAVKTYTLGFNPSATYSSDLSGSVSNGTVRTNSTDYMMQVTIETLNAGTVEVSANGTTGWTVASKTVGGDRHISNVLVRPGWSWRPMGFGSISFVTEFS